MPLDEPPRDPELGATAGARPHASLARRALRRPDEGIRTGVVGATAIWLWLVAVDLIAGSPLYTPRVLGRGLLGIILPGASAPLWADVLAFTILHYGLWVLLGTLVVRAVRADVRTPGTLVGAIVIIILLQLGLVGITAMLAQVGLHRMAWPAIFGGNLVGWLATSLYLLRRHPEIPAELRRDDEA